ETMLKRDIPDSVTILHKLKEKYNLYGLTNSSAETFTITYSRYPLFNTFKGIVVSDEEKLIKPDPRIFQLLFDRYRIQPENSLFIDDNINNIKAAEKLGLKAIHFQSPAKLENELLVVGCLKVD